MIICKDEWNNHCDYTIDSIQKRWIDFNSKYAGKETLRNQIFLGIHVTQMSV